jgi:hypothetical protein
MKKLLASLVAVLTLLPAQATSADILNLSAGGVSPRRADCA